MTRILCVLTLILFALPAVAGEIADSARVIDGDTIEIAGTRVHLHGIDAPEPEQADRRD